MIGFLVLAMFFQTPDASIEAALTPPVPLDQARQNWIRCQYDRLEDYERQNESAEITVRAILKSCERDFGFYYIALHDDFLRKGMKRVKADQFIDASVRRSEDDLLELIMKSRAKP